VELSILFLLWRIDRYILSFYITTPVVVKDKVSYLVFSLLNMFIEILFLGEMHLQCYFFPIYMIVIMLHEITCELQISLIVHIFFVSLDSSPKKGLWQLDHSSKIVCHKKKQDGWF
ncbi:hypothetical protein ACJX0J_029058, partial [Zea mays]